MEESDLYLYISLRQTTYDRRHTTDDIRQTTDNRQQHGERLLYIDVFYSVYSSVLI